MSDTVTEPGSPRSAATPPRLCVVGPLVGGHDGYVTTQGEILAAHFEREGYDVVAASTSTSRLVRLVDILGTLVRRLSSIDIVLLQVYGGPSFVVEDLSSRLTRLFGTPLVMHLRGGAMPEFMARHPRWAVRVLERADAIVAPSHFLRRAVEPYGLEGRVIPNLIDLGDYPFRRRDAVRPALFWMRTFHPLYNPAMALRVLARVRDRFPGASLTMAGQDKGLEEDVRAEAERMGLGDAVRFVGFLDPAGKIREAGRSDIFLNTNHVDNTPVSLIEAWAMGLPVVATDVGGVRWLVDDGDTGLLVPDDDDAAMAEEVCRLVESPALARRLSVNGRRVARESSWDNVHGQWLRVFEELLDRFPVAESLAVSRSTAP